MTKKTIKKKIAPKRKLAKETIRALCAISAIFCAVIQPMDVRSIADWASENIWVEVSPFPGWWELENSIWVKPVLEAFQDPNCNTLVIRCPAQTAKTETAMVLMRWAICEDPGNMMWVVARDEDITDFINDRLVPAINKSPRLKELFVEQKKNKIIFKNCILYVVSAGSKAALQGKPLKYIFCDEARNYKQGRLGMVLKRISAFWNGKAVVLSTPDEDGDSFDTKFTEGTQETNHLVCPCCKQVQPFVFSPTTFIWDRNETTKPNGQYNWAELAKTIRYRCANPDCHDEKTGKPYEMYDEPRTRRIIADTSVYIQKNSMPAPKTRSVTWSPFVARTKKWIDIAKEYIQAKRMLREVGDYKPLYNFYTETLGLPWKKEYLVDKEKDSLQDVVYENYSYKEEWPQKRFTTMCVDRQKDHYWYVIREYAEGFHSRLREYGKILTKEDLEKKRQEFNLNPKHCGLDVGYLQTDCLNFCNEFGWMPLKGEDNKSFQRKAKFRNEKTKSVEVKTVKSSWTVTYVQHNCGQRGMAKMISVILWSNPSIKDRFCLLRSGNLSQWRVPIGVGAEYVSQVTAEKQVHVPLEDGGVKTEYKASRDNHLGDCELMCDVMRQMKLEAERVADVMKGKSA